MSRSPLEHSRSLAAVFSPVRPAGLVEEISRRIEAAVETGLLSAGQRLPNETEFAAALGVSAVTVREALSRLRALGIVVTTRGRHGGSVIAYDAQSSTAGAMQRLRDMTMVQIADLGVHYEAIAGACAALAAKRSTSADVDGLRSYAEAPADDPHESRLIDAEFMLEVATIARSARLARELLRLQTDLGNLSLLPNTSGEFRKQAANCRAAITAAIESRDPAAAESAARELAATSTNWLLSERSTIT